MSYKSPTISCSLTSVAEIGKGTRTMYGYVPGVSGGRNPVIDEKDEFKVTIPYLLAGPDADTADNADITSTKTRVNTKEKILKLIKDNNKISTEELAIATEISDKGIEWQLNNLKKTGKLKRLGPSNGGHWEVID